MKKNTPSVYGSNGFLMIIALAIVLIFVGILLAKGVNKKLDELNSHETSSQQTSQILPISTQTMLTQIIIPTQQTQSSQVQNSQQVSTPTTQIIFPGTQQATDPSVTQFMATKPLVLDGSARVQYKISQFKKLASQPLKFKLFDGNGKELTPEYLKTEQEHKLHFFLVSANLKEYLHLYPDYENGVWNVKAYMPTPGTYYSYISFTPIKGQATILRNTLIVRNATQGTPDYPAVSTNNVAFTSGYELKLKADSLVEKRSNIFSFTLTQNGKTVSNIQPYNGSFGNIMVFKHGDPMTIFPLTPLATTDEANGRFDFLAAFKDSGRYSALAEFFVGQKLLIFTFTFDIGSRSS